MKKEKEQIKFTKIEVDKNTSEPKLVEISEQSFEKELAHDEVIEEVSVPKETISKHSDKQIVMNRVFGIDNKNDSVDKRQKIFKNLFTILFFVLVIGVLIYTFLNDFILGDKEFTPFETLLATFSTTWFYLLLALFSLFLMFLFKGLKLSSISKALTKKWRFRTCMETAIIGLYYNNVTPLAVGGQPFEIYHLSKNGFNGATATSMTIATYFLGQLGFVILGLVAVICFNANAFGMPADLLSRFPTTFTILALIGLLFCLLLPVVVILFCMLPKVGAKLVSLVIRIGGKLRIIKNVEKTTAKTIETVVSNADCLKHVATSPLAFTINVVLSFAEHLAQCSIAYFTLRFFGFDMIAVQGFSEWLQICTICFLLYSAISFIPTPGNSGAADLSFYILFSWGISYVGGAFTSMLIWRVLSFYSTIIIGFVFTKIKKSSDRKKQLLNNQ